jgi:tetratricopeptide (TPR) repeat protein
LNEDFCSDIVNLRIGEALYKLTKVKEAIESIEISARTIKDSDRYMIHQLKGKCFDKLKDFPSAIEEYQLALQNAKEQGHDNEIVGNLEYRLGWSMIRQREDI